MRKESRDRTRFRPLVDALDRRSLPSQVPAPLPLPFAPPRPTPPTVLRVAKAAPPRRVVMIAAARMPFDGVRRPRPGSWRVDVGDALFTSPVRPGSAIETMAERPSTGPEAEEGPPSSRLRDRGKLPAFLLLGRVPLAEGEAREGPGLPPPDSPWWGVRAWWEALIARARRADSSDVPDLSPEASLHAPADIAAPATAHPWAPFEDWPDPFDATAASTTELAAGMTGFDAAGIAPVRQSPRPSSRPPAIRSRERPAAVESRLAPPVVRRLRARLHVRAPREARPSRGVDVIAGIAPRPRGALEASLLEFLGRVDELRDPTPGRDARPPGPFPLLTGIVALEAARRWHRRRRSALEALGEERPRGLALRGSC